MWIVPVICMLSFLGSCHPGRQLNTGNNGDTLLLYKKDTLLITGRVPSVLQCRLPHNATAQYDSRRKSLLFLDEPKVMSIPDGVYELYITLQRPESQNLLSSQPAFVNLLDLYSLTAPSAPNYLAIDISANIKKLFPPKQPLQPVYIILLFRGIAMPDGSTSAQAGELRIKGIRIVQVKN